MKNIFARMTRMNRRAFLKGAAAAPVAVAPPALSATSETKTAAPASDFVRIASDGRITVIVKHVEAGQGPATGLATLVAEEMNADWALVDIVFAPADNARYANLFFGVQGTGGSTAAANSFAQYRKAGAAALSRLRAAAAKQWNTAPDNIRAENGMLLFGEKRAGYGEMASAAELLPPPAAEPALKKPADFVHIGKENRPRKDLAGKINGKAKYAMDIRPDNLLYAVVARAPKFGGVLKSFDDSAARAVAGFAGAAQIPTGVAIYGETIWAAIKARRALKTEWDFSRAETRSSAQMLAEYQAALDAPGISARKDGDAETALAGAHKTVSADFSFPFLAHAPMEPLNCVIQLQDGAATLWDGCQMPGLVQGAVAAVLELPPEKVNIISMLAGGTFGRRATPVNDYQTEAAHALKKSPAPRRPLKVLWTREDDIQGGFYRPMFAHRVKAGLDKNGNITAWRQNIAGKSILTGTPFEEWAVKDGVDNSSVEGAANLPYSAANIDVDVRNMETPVPVLWWRSVGHTHTAFAAETMMDMLAEAAGEDAVAFRLRHLRGHPRHAGVLRAAAKAAKWGEPAPSGRFRGVAVHESFNSYTAQVAEISLKNGAVKVEKITCAVDCGLAINPDIIRAQMEGGIGYGLGAAMRNQITLEEGGEARETNFPNYEPMRMKDMPEIETVIVASAEAPTGVGEPGVPPAAPALAAAIYAATGKRVTHLPFAAHGVRFV
ncbi:MAG: molybdopterin cofactor-binding domain-containing protein [Gammaproteobacteria bacterium]